MKSLDDSGIDWSKRKVGRTDPTEYEKTDRISIFTCGHPRSGNTWMNRLLSDILSAGMQVPNHPGAEVQYWGKGHDSKYCIRKTHSLVELPGPTVYMQRDPRDVCVSAMHYRKLTTIQQVLRGDDRRPDFHGFAGYAPHAEYWLPRIDDESIFMVKYEDLHDKEKAVSVLGGVVGTITGESYSYDWLSECYDRQTFPIASVRLGDRHSMWRGKAGNWREFFDREMGEMFDERLGDLMLKLDYIEDRDWWKSL